MQRMGREAEEIINSLSGLIGVDGGEEVWDKGVRARL